MALRYMEFPPHSTTPPACLADEFHTQSRWAIDHHFTNARTRNVIASLTGPTPIGKIAICNQMISSSARYVMIISNDAGRLNQFAPQMQH